LKQNQLNYDYIKNSFTFLNTIKTITGMNKIHLKIKFLLYQEGL